MFVCSFYLSLSLLSVSLSHARGWGAACRWRGSVGGVDRGDRGGTARGGGAERCPELPMVGIGTASRLGHGENTSTPPQQLQQSYHLHVVLRAQPFYVTVEPFYALDADPCSGVVAEARSTI